MNRVMLLIFVLASGILIGMCIERRMSTALCPIATPCERVQ
jgi:hypothetical protein